MKSSRRRLLPPPLLLAPLLLAASLLPHVLARSDVDAECEINRPTLSPRPIPPTWQASFPGSGSRMTRYLMEALTGVGCKNLDLFTQSLGGWGRRDDERTRVAAVKTHYPVNNAEGFERVDHLFDRAIVIFRNPINAFASLFNQNYERWHKLPNHSVRGPQEDWIDWRQKDRGVPQQLQRFEEFVVYWMDKYNRKARPKRLLMVSYEDLTDPWLGPVAAGKIAKFLSVEGVETVNPKSVPCVWDAVVNFKSNHGGAEMADEEEGRKRRLEEVTEMADEESGIRGGGRRLEAVNNVDPSSLRSGPKVRPYTFEDLNEMAAMLQRLLQRYSDDEYFVRTFSGYLNDIMNTPVEQGRWEMLQQQYGRV